MTAIFTGSFFLYIFLKYSNAIVKSLDDGLIYIDVLFLELSSNEGNMKVFVHL